MAGVDRQSRSVPCSRPRASARTSPSPGGSGLRASRKNVSFLHLFDGSTPNTLQAVLPATLDEATIKRLSSAPRSGRRLIVASPGTEQPFELAASSVEVIGDCPGGPESYPMQKKATSMEFLRTVAHLRPRSNTHQAVFRVRNALAWQIHRFFQERGFLWMVPHPDHRRGGRGRRRRAVPARERTGVLRPPGGADRLGAARGRVLRPVPHRRVHLRTDTFRAEHEHPRHPAEFWMIEPEVAFAEPRPT